jgi:hypothetical protein
MLCRGPRSCRSTPLPTTAILALDFSPNGQERTTRFRCQSVSDYFYITHRLSGPLGGRIQFRTCVLGAVRAAPCYLCRLAIVKHPSQRTPHDRHATEPITVITCNGKLPPLRRFVVSMQFADKLASILQGYRSNA